MRVNKWWQKFHYIPLTGPGLAAFDIKLKKCKGIKYPLFNLIPPTMNPQLIQPTSASHDPYASISSTPPPPPPPHAHCPFIHTTSCFLSPLSVVLRRWLKCLCFRRRQADDRAPLSAPKNLTRAHNRKTSQVRVSGIARGTFADWPPTCNKIRAQGHTLMCPTTTKMRRMNGNKRPIYS